MEMMKTREAESSLWLEFDCRLTEEREVLSAKYNNEVDDLHASLESKVKNRDAKISELETLQAFDSKQHDDDLSAWRAWDRKLHSGLLGLEEALRGRLLLPLPSLCFFKLFSHFLAALAGAFPDSDEAAIAALEKYRAEQKIIPCGDPEAKFTSGELMALVKGRLHPVAKLGGELCQAVTSVFKDLWPGRAVPGDIETLLKWIPLVSNRVDVWKESLARTGAAQALEFVLSWYPGVSLDQLEHLREGGLAALDEAKLHQRARAIAECADTSVLFDAGESDESLDDADFKEPSSAEAPQKSPKDLADNSIPPFPSGNDFVLAARTGDAAPLEPASSPSAP
jgi:hypothetical protein